MPGGIDSVPGQQNFGGRSMRVIGLVFAIAALAALGACGKPSGDAPSETSPQIESSKAPPGVKTEPAAAQAGAAPQTADDIGAPASASAPLTDAQLAVVYKVLGFMPAPGGQVMNDCGEAITPGVYAAELGGEIGRAYLIVMTGGPNTATCYGDGPAFWLVKTEGDSFRLIFQDRYYFAIMPTEHNGVKDIAVGGPGFEFPVYAWNGTEYVFSRNIKDTEMPAPLN